MASETAGLTKEIVASQLDGNEYGKEGSRELFKAMEAAGLVAVFGASDDLMEFRGAIDDEIGAYNGATAYLDAKGLLVNDCDNDDCPHFEKLKAKAATIDAVWAPEGDTASWDIRTAIPHAKFNIMEDGEPFCHGIVFDLSSLHTEAPLP